MRGVCLTRFKIERIIITEHKKGGAMFIEFEGISGSGKTTQCELLKPILENVGYSVTIVNEPDMTKMGTTVDSILCSNTPRDRITEMFLFLAKEAELHSQIISLEDRLPNNIIFRDGGRGSFLSYNHINTRLSIQTLERLHDRANAHQIPAVSILLDVPVDVALKRILNRHKRSRFDVLPRVFLKTQSDILEHLATMLPNWIAVDGSLEEDEVTSKILNKMSKIDVR